MDVLRDEAVERYRFELLRYTIAAAAGAKVKEPEYPDVLEKWKRW